MVATGPRQSLLHNLQYLRKGPGLTLSRLERAEAVIQACGGPDEPTATTMERLLSAIRSLPDPGDRDALLAAMNAEHDGPVLLKARRAAHGRRVGKAAYTVAAWEDRAITELVLRLITGFYAAAATPPNLPIPHGGYVIRKLTITSSFQDLVFVEDRQERDIVSLVHGARGFTYGTYSPTELSDLTGCRLHETRVAAGGYLHELHFAQPLRRGQPHRFGFTERVPTSAAEQTDTDPVTDVDFAGQTFETPTLEYRQVVHFDGAQPEMVWSYDKLSRIERPGQPTGQYPGRDTIDVSFFDLYGGLCAGVAWTRSHP